MLALSDWLSTFAFSRRVKHLPRDFSDAVLLAELLAQLLPAGAVQLHNYPPASRFQQKLVNWETLNRKVLTPLRCELPHSLLEELAAASPSAIALALVQVKKTIETTTKAPRSPTKTNAPTSPPQAPTFVSPPSSPVCGVSSIPRANAVSKTRSMSAGADKLTSKLEPSKAPSATSQQRQLRPPSPTKRLSQPLLRDFLPLPQERPTPEALVSTFSRVLHRTQASSPKSKSPKAAESRLMKVNEGEVLEVRSRASTCDSSDDGSVRSQRLTMSSRKELTIEVQRREWPASPKYAKPQSPPSQFKTTELTRHKLSSISVLTLDAEVIQPPADPPIVVHDDQVDTVQLELCATPPTVFPRVLVDVDVVLASPPARFRRKL